MARDLIPPPSPAGRPLPDDSATRREGSAPRLVELPPEPPRSPAQPAQEPSPGPSAFRNRFGFLIGALGGVFIASAVLLAAVLSSGGAGASAASEGLAPNWSKWQPADTSLEGGSTQIADHVGSEYKHSNGRQLLKVQASPLPVEVALRPATGNISIIDGPGVLYQLNGLGPNGSIKGGTPSESRLQLVRREALELALYTFRYLPDVKMVVTLLPPPPPTQDGTAAAATAGLVSAAADPNTLRAVFYRPGDLKPQLQVPLGLTVPAKAPTPEAMGGAEGKMVDQLTLANVFKWSVSTAQDKTTYLVLDRES
jgi:hypothetical protein